MPWLQFKRQPDVGGTKTAARRFLTSAVRPSQPEPGPIHYCFQARPHGCFPHDSQLHIIYVMQVTTICWGDRLDLNNRSCVVTMISLESAMLYLF
ncbi:uncharacterized [Tachysurus ichikawai]